MLRRLMARIELLAGDVEDGYTARAVLWECVDQLRQALDAHNRHEERLLRPLLRELEPDAAAEHERLLLDHVGEHRALNEQLHAGTIEALREAIGVLRVHLDAEDARCAASRVLRDDPPQRCDLD